MSRIIANNNNNKKPFCKVCADAGKTDTAHFVRLNANPDSPVTCPTLLALECRYCYKSGHTVKYCSILKKNNKENERAMRRTLTTLTPPVVPKPTKKDNNKFAALMDDNDDEETPIHIQQQDTRSPHDSFPSITTSATNTNNIPITWASRAAAVAHVNQPIYTTTDHKMPSQYINIDIDDYDLEPPQYDDNDLEEAYQEVQAQNYNKYDINQRIVCDDDW